MMHLDPRRTARLILLLIWTGFFAYLWFSGEVSRYLGPRTYWVVPVGAIVLGLAALAHVGTLHSDRPAALTAGEAAGMLVLILPIMAILIVPAPELGALAASKKNAASGGAIAATSSVVPPPPEAGREISFIDIFYASESQEYAAALGIADGTEVSLTGFVTHPRNIGDATFALTRFYVSCCAADAVPYSVEVAPDAGRDFDDDTWLDVTGTLQWREDRWVLVPEAITESSTPRDPYLY